MGALPGPRSALSLRILGPLRIQRNGTEVQPGARQQALLLGALLARSGQPVGVADLIDLIWAESPPASAANVIQKYVSAVRRLLEPGLPPRDNGSYLLRRGTGYVFLADREVVDAAAFRALTAEAQEAAGQGREDLALDRYVAALGLWQGPAGDGLTAEPARPSIFAELDEQFVTACLAASELAASLNQAGTVLPFLRAAAAMNPLHEPVQAALISTLADRGERAEALAVFEGARTRLADELGIDPGPPMRAAYQRAARPAGSAQDDQPASAAPGIVGRNEELAVLRQELDAVVAGGTALMVTEGEPGSGKTRLLEVAATLAASRGVHAAWGHCRDGDGAPAMWPWVQVIDSVLDVLPEAARRARLAGELGRLVGHRGAAAGTVILPDGAAQFRLFELIVAVLAEISARRALLLIIDDLHWADAASLHLFGHLAARLPPGVMLAGALRTHAPAPGAELIRTLAAASRTPGHRRVRLGPLDRAEVAELIARVTGSAPAPAVVEQIHLRTAGNPFYVRELARLMADGGALSAAAGVPSSVLDVVRDRMAALPDDTRGLLQVAALLGRDIDLRLLARAAGLGVQDCLVRLEPVESLGLLAPAPDDLFAYRFVHDLVRDSISGTTPPLRAPGLHLRIADAIEHAGPVPESSAEDLAGHLWAAGPLADPGRVAGALISAGRSAAAKSAFDAAERWLLSAVEVTRAANLAEPELSALSQLVAVAGSQTMYHVRLLDQLDRAESLARDLGRELDATDFLFSRWVALSQGTDFGDSDRLVTRLRESAEASGDPRVRAYGLHAWGIRQLAVGDIEAGHRLLTRSVPVMRDGLGAREDHPIRFDLVEMTTGLFTEVTAMRGDLDEARSLLDTLKPDDDDRFRTTIWSAFSARTAMIAGDPAWALRAADLGIAADPEFSFGYLGTYQRLSRCWALALTGQDPRDAAAEARHLIATRLADPPRPRFAIWHAPLAAIAMAAGDLDDAQDVLDQADAFLDRYDQRYQEPMVLLQRARLVRARGEPEQVVRAAAVRARDVATSRGARLFARQADELLDDLVVLADSPAAGRFSPE